MSTKKSASAALQSYLLSVQAAVNKIIDPTTGLPVQVPDFETVYAAAGKIDHSSNPDAQAYVINSLLGRANNYDFASPPDNYTVNFPDDHHIHITMGNEWYWLGCHLNVTAPDGAKGRIGVLVSIQKDRCLGLTEQKAAGWTDEESLICGNIVTATLDMANGEKKIVRRNRNCQWPKTGGEVGYSKPGDKSFWFKCGADSVSAPLEMLPMTFVVNDGDNIAFSLQVDAKPDVKGNAYFLQGIPSPFGNGGTGVTPIPTPGIYYSWPQLLVTGAIMVEGVNYTIDSGIGWVDHQLMMSSLENPKDAAHPVPFIEDSVPFNGWTWQFYNFENGDAFTGAAFVLGEMVNNPKITYGYYLTLINGEWLALFSMGDNQLLNFMPFPAPVCPPSPQSTQVNFPVNRSYQEVKSLLPLVSISGMATSWYHDGTFNNSNWSVGAENPADYVDTTGAGSNGLGFLEAIGFESVESFRTRLLYYLETGNFPC